MKKGIVKANMITLKRGGYAYKNKPITEADVNNFDDGVKNGSIELVEEKKEVKKEVKKAK